MTEEQTIKHGLDRISEWARIHYEGDDKKIVPGMCKTEIEKIVKNFPFKLPKEIFDFYENGHTSIYFSPAPNQFLPLQEIYGFAYGFSSQAAKDVFSTLNTTHANLYEVFPENEYCEYDLENIADWCEITIAYGSGKELYQIRCYRSESKSSPIWNRGVGMTPYIYASSLTNLILANAECYERGAYYPVLLENDGDDFYVIEADWTKAESICKKYNPNQIDEWRGQLENL